MISNEQRAIIDKTLPTVEANALAITSCFYPLMFERYPAVKDYFNMANQIKGTQREALANAFIAYAKHLDKLEALSSRVSSIAQKHCSLGILPEHYPIVGECLLAAIAEVLGEAVSDEVLDAWGAAYQQLADLLISMEIGIYDDIAQRQGGWSGLQQFQVVEKTVESDVISSFLLKPCDKSGPIDFLPGQYIAVIKSIDGQQQRRNYSISSAPGQETLRISVKREAGGILSNHLHTDVTEGDTLSLTAPCGDFILRDNNRPIVLLTAGVGITPALSMLKAATSTHAVAGRKIQFIHCARNSQDHAFMDECQQVQEEHSEVTIAYLYSHPTQQDLNGESGYKGEFGFINTAYLSRKLEGNSDIELYVLGPKPFMQQALQSAIELGIPESQTHYEFFGPHEELYIQKA